jgi:hypothetical protein
MVECESTALSFRSAEWIDKRECVCVCVDYFKRTGSCVVFILKDFNGWICMNVCVCGLK